MGGEKAWSGPDPGMDDAGLILDINTTPLIDVLLVLLVMLIVTIPIQLHAVHLALPGGTPPAQMVGPDAIRIDIDARSAVYWQGVAVDWPELETRMTALAAAPPQAPIHLRTDKDAQYAAFAGVLAATKRTGLTRVSVVGSEEFAQ